LKAVEFLDLVNSWSPGPGPEYRVINFANLYL
jgi:hypothetical protein